MTQGRLLCWLTVPGESYDEAVALDVDVTAYSVAELDAIAAAAADAGRVARVQLKVDTGLSRGGVPAAQWSDVFARAREGELAGSWQITGVWSHFACSDEPDNPANDLQESRFRVALAAAEQAGLQPEVRHLGQLGRRDCSGRAPASTRSAAASPSTASTRRPARPPTSVWCRR